MNRASMLDPGIWPCKGIRNRTEPNKNSETKRRAPRVRIERGMLAQDSVWLYFHHKKEKGEKIKTTKGLNL